MATILMYSNVNVDDAYYPVWCAVAGTTVGASSTDPVTGGTPWTARTLSESLTWNSCCFGDKLCVAVGGTSSIGSKSPDGTTWTDFTLPASRVWQAVAYGNGTFVAVCNGAVDSAKSIDGAVWSSGGSLQDAVAWYSISYGSVLVLGTPTPTFVAVANTNAVVAARTIDNGTNWTRTTIASGNWRSVCYGNNRFVAVSYGSSVGAYTTDGITWETSTLPSSKNWIGVCYGNNIFVAIAYGSSVAAWSSDGVTWAELLLPAVANWQSISYGTVQSATNQGLAVFTILANTGTVSCVSYDGITWATATQLSAAYTAHCYCPFPWNSGDTLSIQNNATITVSTNQTKFWNAITATYGKLKIENTSSTTGNYFQMGRTSGSAACSLTVGSGLFSIDIDGNWIYLADGDGSSGQTFTIPFTEYIPMIEVETAIGSNVYEQWLNITGAFGPYMKIMGKDGLEWVGNGKRGNYFVQTPASNPIDILTLTNGATTIGSYYITYDSNTNIVAGANITGTGIPATAVVNRVISATKAEMSVVSTATGSALTFRVYNPMMTQLQNQISIGNGINGNTIGAGRKVRVPNLMISNASPVNYAAANNQAETYIIMTNACPIDARICYFGQAYVYLNQPSLVYMRHVGFSYPFYLNECYNVDMDYIGIAGSPTYWYYTTKWICRDQRWSTVPPFGYTASIGNNSTWSYIHGAQIKNLHYVVYSPSKFTGTSPTNLLTLSLTNDATLENIRIACLWPSRAVYGLYFSDSAYRNTITTLEIYGISPLAFNNSSDNTINNFEYSLSMTSTIQAFKTVMRIGDDPATGLPLVDDTPYFFKLRSFRSWMDRTQYFDSNEYSATPFQSGWQFPDYLSVRPTETIAPSVTIDWAQRNPSTALVVYEIYRSTTQGFTDRTINNRMFGGLSSTTVTCAQGQKVVSNSAVARIMTFSSAAKTIVLSGASAGTWAGTDFFQVGDTIYVQGSYLGNNGAKTVTAISGVTLTVAETLYDEVGTLSPIIQIYKITSKSSATRPFTFAVGKTITIGAGQSWLTADGFAVGDVVDITGSRNLINNGPKTINTLTATVMTVNEPLAAEVTPTSTSAATTRIFTFASSGNTLTVTGTTPGSLITDGHFIGDTVYCTSTLNPGPFVITALTATVMTVTGTVTNETCAAGTIIYRRVIITLRAPNPGTRYYYKFRKYNFNSIAALQCTSPGLLFTTNRAVTGTNLATITTAVAHGFIVGQSVKIAGLGDAAYNGTFTIGTVPSTTTFTYALAHANESVADALGLVSGADIRSTYRSVSGNIATITTNIPHKFKLEQSVLISGMTDSTYNGTYSVLSVPSTATFTYALTHIDESNTADTAGTLENITIFSGVATRNVTVTKPTSTSTVSKTFTFNAGAKTITVAGGDWIADGHSVWDQVVISGSGAGNNGTFTISVLTTTVMTVLETIYAEVGDASPVIVVTGNSYALVTTTIAHGLLFGQTIKVGGFADAAYNGTFTVRAVPSTTTVSYQVTHANAAIVDDNAGIISNTNLDFDNVYYLSGFRFASGTKYVTNLINNIYNSMFAPGVEISGPGIAAGTKVESVDPSGREMILDTNTTTSTDNIFATTFNVVKRSILTNVATIVTDVAHNLDIGAKIRLTEMGDSTYNGTFVITAVLSPTRIRFALTHADETERVNLAGVLTVVDIVLTIPTQTGLGVYGAIGTTEGIAAGTQVISRPNSYMVGLSQKTSFATNYTIITFQTFNESAEFTSVPNLYAKAINYCLQSNDFATTWVNSNLTVTANIYAGPIMLDFATGTMDTLTAAASPGTRTMTVSGLKPSTQYTASIYVRADQTLALPNGVAGSFNFGTTNTAFTATNEIKRVTATATTGAGVTSLTVVISVTTSGQIIFAGDVNVNLGATAQASIATTTLPVDLFPCATPLAQLRSYCRNQASCGSVGNQGIEVNIGTAASGEYFHEIHVSTTPGFTPSASTLATSSFAADTSHISFIQQCLRNKVVNITKLGTGSAAAALGVLYFTGTSTDNKIINGDIDIQYCNSATIPVVHLVTAAHNNLIHNINFGRIKNYTSSCLIFTQATNAIGGNRIQNIRAKHYDVPISLQMQNSVVKGLPSGRALPAVGATTYAIGGTVDGVAAGATGYVAVYGSQFSELYTSDTEGLLNIAMEESQTLVKPYNIKAGLPVFDNKGRLEMINANSVVTVNRSRATNIATLETLLPHKLLLGDEVLISSVGGTGYNGTHIVATVLDSYHFTYANVGDAESETSDNNGIVTVGDSIEWVWPYKLKGISGFRKLFPKILTVDMGTQTDLPEGVRVDISIGNGTTWSNYIEATPVNLNGLVVSEVDGFYLKVKLTAVPFMKYRTLVNPIYAGDVIKGSKSGVTAVVKKDYNYGLTGTLELNKISGTFYPLEILVLSNNTTRSTTFRAVASNVATITTNTAHGMAVGYWVSVSGMTDSTYNGTYLVASVPSTTTFTYALIHGNEGSVADTNGTVTIGRNLCTNVTTNGFAIGPSFTSLVNVLQLFTSYTNQSSLYPSLVYPLTVKIVDSSLNPISGTIVRVTATSTVGNYTIGDILLVGLTDEYGSITTDIESILDIPLSIRARKSTSEPFYKPADMPALFVGGIGLNITMVLILDQ